MTPSRQNNPVEPSSGREAAPAPERGKGPAGRRPRLNLPFDNRREDAGSWAYDHRVGLCVTLIAYLVVMIVFVSSKIVIGQRAQTQGMFIDLQTLSELEEQREQLEEEVRQRQQDAADWASIRNRMSNENAAEGELRDDRGTDMRALDEAASDAEERAIRERRGGGKTGESSDVKVKGRVTVSFSLKNPVRTKRYLEVPAYRCESGGEVVVEITVNRAGEVTAARVRSGGDACMREMAERAARNSLFNIDDSAPARQTGTITYIFIPQ